MGTCRIASVIGEVFVSLTRYLFCPWLFALSLKWFPPDFSAASRSQKVLKLPLMEDCNKFFWMCGVFFMRTRWTLTAMWESANRLRFFSETKLLSVVQGGLISFPPKRNWNQQDFQHNNCGAQLNVGKSWTNVNLYLISGSSIDFVWDSHFSQLFPSLESTLESFCTKLFLKCVSKKAAKLAPWSVPTSSWASRGTRAVVRYGSVVHHMGSSRPVFWG